MKKILSLLVCVCLILSAMVITASAAETASYVKVTEAPADWSGDYLIVYEDGANTRVLNGGLSKIDAEGNYIKVAMTDGVIEANDTTNAAKFTVEKYNNGYSLKSASGYYMGNTSNQNKIITNKTTKYENTLTLKSDDTVDVVSAGSYLRSNIATTNGNRFRYYKSSSYTNQKAICLYKLVTTTGDDAEDDDTTCTHAATSTEANGDETHKVVCDDCGETVSAAVDCADADVNGKCDVCGGDVAIPVQDPAADSTLTIADAIALGASKAHNVYTAGKYYVTGVITEVYQTTYGNMKLTDGDGNILTVYGTYSADGETRYGDLEVKPVAGDTVTVYGIVGQYNGTPQVKNGWITAHTPATTPDGGDDNTGDDNTGDDNTGDDNTGDDNTGDDNTGDAPAADLAVVDSVVAGKAYKFGMVQANLADGNVYYLAGGMNGYYMATTTDATAAIDIYVEETTGGYYLYTMVDGVKTYINMVVSGTHVNGAYEAAASTVYTFDATAKTFVATVNDELYWFATRNDNTYTTLGPAKVSFEGFYGQFYAEPVVDDNTGDDNTNDDTTDDNKGESTEKPEVKPEGDNSTTSPATGDNMGAVVALAMVAGAAVVFANKKR